jgi:hypothetical protein
MSGGTKPVDTVLDAETSAWMDELRTVAIKTLDLLNTVDPRCRKCGRKLVGQRAIECGYGERCRRFVYRAARVLEADGLPARRAASALLEKRLVPTGHKGTWYCKSSDGTDRYITAPNTCSCKGARFRPVATSCYHSAAATVLATPLTSQTPVSRVYSL